MKFFENQSRNVMKLFAASFLDKNRVMLKEDGEDFTLESAIKTPIYKLIKNIGYQFFKKESSLFFKSMHK